MSAPVRAHRSACTSRTRRREQRANSARQYPANTDITAGASRNPAARAQAGVRVYLYTAPSPLAEKRPVGGARARRRGTAAPITTSFLPLVTLTASPLVSPLVSPSLLIPDATRFYGPLVIQLSTGATSAVTTVRGPRFSAGSKLSLFAWKVAIKSWLVHSAGLLHAVEPPAGRWREVPSGREARRTTRSRERATFLSA